MIAQKVEDMLGKALASFLLLLLGDGAIEATSPVGGGGGGGGSQTVSPVSSPLDRWPFSTCNPQGRHLLTRFVSSNMVLLQESSSSQKAKATLKHAGLRRSGRSQLSSRYCGEPR